MTRQNFIAQNVNFKQQVLDSFTQQLIMQTLQAKLLSVEAGEVSIELPFQENLTQQHGYIHAGIIATIMDSACGYAAFSLMPAGAEVLSIEFKINLLSPAVGEKFVASAKVIRPGKNIMVTEGKFYAQSSAQTKLIASMTATMMCLRNQ